MKKPSKIHVLWSSIIVCFVLMASPLILLFDHINWTIMGVPLTYLFVFVLWVILCVLTFIGYRLKWGHKDDK